MAKYEITFYVQNTMPELVRMHERPPSGSFTKELIFVARWGPALLKCLRSLQREDQLHQAPGVSKFHEVKLLYGDQELDALQLFLQFPYVDRG